MVWPILISGSVTPGPLALSAARATRGNTLPAPSARSARVARRDSVPRDGSDLGMLFALFVLVTATAWQDQEDRATIGELHWRGCLTMASDIDPVEWFPWYRRY